MMGVKTRIVWDHAKVQAILSAGRGAHVDATLAAAEAAAQAVSGPQSKGTIEADLRQPKIAGMRAVIGTSAVHGRIQHFGGVIRAKRKPPGMLISASEGDIRASAMEVRIRGKRYLDAATGTYVKLMPQAYRARFPR